MKVQNRNVISNPGFTGVRNLFLQKDFSVVRYQTDAFGNDKNGGLILAITVAIFLMVAGFTNAQEVLTPQDAVKIALENNYSIKIAKNEKDIAENNSTCR